MNADDTKENPWSPEVFDARIMWREGKNVVTDDVYGPMLCKILRNYIPTSKKDIGYYTQRNGNVSRFLTIPLRFLIVPRHLALSVTLFGRHF